jgi:ABC-2 type transport system ATP-binding protein
VEAICDRVIIISKGNIVADDLLSNLQSGNKNAHSVIVQFKEEVEQKLLEQIKDVDNIQQLQSTNYKLQTQNPESVRKQLLELSLQHNLNIVSLQSESKSLEDVFRGLTNN